VLVLTGPGLGPGCSWTRPRPSGGCHQREPLRLHRLWLIQMAALPQRHRLLHHQSHAGQRPDTVLPGLVCRRGPV